jgi:predicted  nucleic acid-binding Zn-ribbon protein
MTHMVSKPESDKIRKRMAEVQDVLDGFDFEQAKSNLEIETSEVTDAANSARDYADEAATAAENIDSSLEDAMEGVEALESEVDEFRTLFGGLVKMITPLLAPEKPEIGTVEPGGLNPDDMRAEAHLGGDADGE